MVTMMMTMRKRMRMNMTMTIMRTQVKEASCYGNLANCEAPGQKCCRTTYERVSQQVVVNMMMMVVTMTTMMMVMMRVTAMLMMMTLTTTTTIIYSGFQREAEILEKYFIQQTNDMGCL